MDKKDYDLLQEGDDWTVMSWNPLSGGWVKSVTYHSDSWGHAARGAAQHYIIERRISNQYRSEIFLTEMGVLNEHSTKS